MEYIDSWVFNRGQEITLRKGPKMYYVAVQLFNRYPEHPFVYLRGKDKEKLLLKALKLIKEDVAKDNQDVIYLDAVAEPDTNLTRFPIPVRTETEELDEFLSSPEIQEIIKGDVRRNIHLKELERQWREDED